MWIGGGSVGYIGYMIADIILFGVKAKELCARQSGATSSAASGGSVRSPAAPDISAASSTGRQVVRIRLGTCDLDEAKERLTVWFLAQQQGPPAGRPISLAEVLVAYNEAHGKKSCLGRGREDFLAAMGREFSATCCGRGLRR